VPRRRSGLNSDVSVIALGQEAKRDQPFDVRRERSPYACRTEPCDRQDQDTAASDTVRHRPATERAHHQSQQPGAEQGAERDHRQLPFGANVRGDKADDRDVEPVQRHDQEAHRADHDLEARHWDRVDEVPYVH